MAKPKKPDLPDLDSLLASVNMEAVAQAIAQTRSGNALPDYEFEDAKRAVWLAAETWLPRDNVEFLVTGIEERQEVCLGATPVKGFLDIIGQTNGLIPALTPYANSHFVLDWKSAAGSLDTAWRERLLNSWQWRLYCRMTGARLFFYRGVSRTGETKELIIETPETNSAEVEQFFSQIAAMREPLL